MLAVRVGLEEPLKHRDSLEMLAELQERVSEDLGAIDSQPFQVSSRGEQRRMGAELAQRLPSPQVEAARADASPSTG